MTNLFIYAFLKINVLCLIDASVIFFGKKNDVVSDSFIKPGDLFYPNPYELP